MGLTRITSDGITDGAIAGSDLADQSVTLAKLPHGTSSNDGKFLQANNGADPTFETVNTDLVADTSPQLGGDLDTNSHNIFLDDDHKVIWGNDQSADLHIFHESSSGTGNIYNATGQLKIRSNDLRLKNLGDSETYLKATNNGAVELYHNNTLRFETTSYGGLLTGQLYVTDYIYIDNQADLYLEDNGKARFGDGSDLQIYHDGSDSYLKHNGTGNFYVQTTEASVEDLYLQAGNDVYIRVQTGENAIKCTGDAGVELFFNGTAKLETRAGDTIFHDDIRIQDNNKINIGTGDDLQIYHNGSNSFIDNSTGSLVISTDAQTSYKANTHQFETADGTETVATFNANGAVELYHNNALRFATESSGVKLYALPNNGGNGYTLFYNSSTGQVSFHNRYRNVIPEQDNSYDLGSSSLRWANVFTADLQLSNKGSSNDVDGTWGSYTIQEGESDLFLINKRNGKKYKFNLTEVS